MIGTMYLVIKNLNRNRVYIEVMAQIVLVTIIAIDVLDICVMWLSASILWVMGYIKQVLEMMQMHPKERRHRVILAASWFIAINVGY